MATEFDFGQLDAISGGDAEFEREVLDEYLKTAPVDIEKLRKALLDGDAKSVGAAAHALNGASATIGAKGFAAIALELEQAGKRNELAGASAVLARLEQEYAELQRMLRTRIGRAA